MLIKDHQPRQVRVYVCGFVNPGLVYDWYRERDITNKYYVLVVLNRIKGRARLMQARSTIAWPRERHLTRVLPGAHALQDVARL